MPKEIKEKIEDWEKEFDEEFGYEVEITGDFLKTYTVGKLKSFIRQLLSQEKQKAYNKGQENCNCERENF